METSPERACREFGEQAFMNYVGARVLDTSEGKMRTSFAVRPELSQNDGFVHAGVLTAVMDTTAGFAAISLLEPPQSILTADFTVNLLRPAIGHSVVVDAWVLKRGRNLIVGRATATAIQSPDADDQSITGEPCAIMTGTFAVVVPRPTKSPAANGS